MKGLHIRWNANFVIESLNPMEIRVENIVAIGIIFMTAMDFYRFLRMNYMNDIEREQVKKLRERGYSYGRIASQLGLSKDTIKSYCRRHGLAGYANPNIAGKQIDDLKFCKTCGMVVIQNPGRKEKKFCSDICRMKWWNNHIDQVKKKAVYDLVCLNCGSSFQTYGNSKRKYCCHDCYVDHRFGRKKAVVSITDEPYRAAIIQKPTMSKEQGENEIRFALTMYQVKCMFEKGIITSADFNKMRKKMIEKYNPIVGTLFYDELREN